MSYKLFLDDIRDPSVCTSYMRSELGIKADIYQEKWEVVRNYDEFIKIIEERGIPEIVSYDHDLADEHYIDGDKGICENKEWKEKTGYDCAKWLSQYCYDIEMKHPPFLVHSMNPVGAQNIKNLLYGKRS